VKRLSNPYNRIIAGMMLPHLHNHTQKNQPRCLIETSLRPLVHSRCHTPFLLFDDIMALFLRSIQIAFELLLIPRMLPSLQLAGSVAPSFALPNFLPEALTDAIWFAVPKKRVTRSKKRLKTTVQYRIKLKENIVTCPRTGELTLRHKLPAAWKKYIPGGEKYD
jgi:ribosomal protein L32